MKQYEYTYKIKQIDVHNGTVLVEFMSTDTNLTSYVLNLPSCLYEEDGITRKPIEDIIKLYAPHTQWENQEILVEQYNDLLHKTELVPIQNA